MSDLPPLPEPFDSSYAMLVAGDLVEVSVFDTDQMQEYARLCVLQERERCLALLIQQGAPRSDEYGDWASVSEAIERGLTP